MRCNLTDGRWFDRSRATRVASEGTRWDGNNHVSLATGSQWDHAELLRTAGGQYVVHSWSQWQGSRPTYEPVSPRDAAAWILRSHDEMALPDELAEYAAEGEA